MHPIRRGGPGKAAPECVKNLPGGKPEALGLPIAGSPGQLLDLSGCNVLSVPRGLSPVEPIQCHCCGDQTRSWLLKCHTNIRRCYYHQNCSYCLILPGMRHSDEGVQKSRTQCRHLDHRIPQRAWADPRTSRWGEAGRPHPGQAAGNAQHSIFLYTYLQLDARRHSTAPTLPGPLQPHLGTFRMGNQESV